MRHRDKKLAPKLLFALLAALVFIASYYLGNQYARPLLKNMDATVLPTPQKVTNIAFTDENGQIFTAASFRDFWNFVLVGNLDDEGCDSLLRLYVSAWNYLAVKPALQKSTRVVFVHTGGNPAETKELKQRIDFYNPAFTALRGDQREIQKLEKQIGLTSDTTHCHLESSTVALINPEGYLLALFTGAKDPAQIASDLQYFD